MVALIGVCLTPPPECGVELPCFRFNLINSSTKPNFLRRINAPANYNRLNTRRRSSIACSVSTQTAGFEDSSSGICSVGDASAFTAGGGGGGGKTAVCYESVEDDLSHVTKFNMSDFSITDRVSIGLTSRVLLSLFIDFVLPHATTRNCMCF